MHKDQQKDMSVVALKYDGSNAPRVTAQGKGHVAAEILAIAQKYDIPRYKDSELVNLLFQLKLGDEIPKSLYLAVAEVITFAYYISGKSVEPQHKIIK